MCIYHTYTYVYVMVLKRFIDSCHLISDLVNCLQFDGLWASTDLPHWRAGKIFFKWVFGKVRGVTVTLSFIHVTKILQTLGWEWVRAWNSTERWSVPSKGQSSTHSRPLSTSHNPPFHSAPCTPQVWLPPTCYHLPDCRQAGRGDTEEIWHTMFWDHMGRVLLSFIIQVAHNGVSPGILTNPIYHTLSSGPREPEEIKKIWSLFMRKWRAGWGVKAKAHETISRQGFVIQDGIV